VSDTRAPLLVTGSHRSGTTWVGRLLGLADGVAHIHEPLNPVYRLSWLDVRPQHWFQHIDDANGPQFEPAFARLLALRPPLVAHLRSVRSPRNLAANARELAQVVRWRAQGARPLVKDPIAFFATEWLARTFDARVIVTVRHPAAFAGSLKRNGWTFDFTNITAQPRLIDAYLQQFADEIERYAVEPPDVVDQAILLWRCINSTVQRYRADHPSWYVLRYEDLAAQPVEGTEALFRYAGLAWTERCEREVRALSSGENPVEAPVRRTRDVRRNSSAAMWTWKDRLTPEEMERVREGTADVASALYTDDDWERASTSTSR
jgi:hypothetical protein